jgi:hypothetical protein
MLCMGHNDLEVGCIRTSVTFSLSKQNTQSEISLLV